MRTPIALFVLLEVVLFGLGGAAGMHMELWRARRRDRRR